MSQLKMHNIKVIKLKINFKRLNKLYIYINYYLRENIL